MTIEFQTSKGEFMAVPWEEGLGKGWLVERISTVMGIYPSEFTEEMAKVVVEGGFYSTNGIEFYENYLYENACHKTALESFESLMAANRIYISNPISKPEIGRDKLYESLDTSNESIYHEDFHKRMDEWREAQQRSSTNWLIIKLNK